MLPAAIEQERLFVAERLLFEIERRHGLPHPSNREVHPVIVDRFLTAYLPETMDGQPAPSALEFAFPPTSKRPQRATSRKPDCISFWSSEDSDLGQTTLARRGPHSSGGCSPCCLQ